MDSTNLHMTREIDQFFVRAVRLEESLEIVWPEGRYWPCLANSGVHFTLPGHARPVSVSRAEGRFLLYLAHLLSAESVFEIGTAFGYSAIMLAAGVSRDGGPGWVCSLDAQLEGDATIKGLEFARMWAGRLGLSTTLHFLQGRSPQDVPTAIGSRQIDLAFIDGNHRLDQPTLDFEALLPHFKPSSVVVWHDVHESYGVLAAIAKAENAGFQTRVFATSCRIAASFRQASLASTVEYAMELALSSVRHGRVANRGTEAN